MIPSEKYNRDPLHPEYGDYIEEERRYKFEDIYETKTLKNRYHTVDEKIDISIAYSQPVPEKKAWIIPTPKTTDTFIETKEINHLGSTLIVPTKIDLTKFEPEEVDIYPVFIGSRRNGTESGYRNYHILQTGKTILKDVPVYAPFEDNYDIAPDNEAAQGALKPEFPFLLNGTVMNTVMKSPEMRQLSFERGSVEPKYNASAGIWQNSGTAVNLQNIYNNPSTYPWLAGLDEDTVGRMYYIDGEHLTPMNCSPSFIVQNDNYSVIQSLDDVFGIKLDERTDNFAGIDLIKHGEDYNDVPYGATNVKRLIRKGLDDKFFMCVQFGPKPTNVVLDFGDFFDDLPTFSTEQTYNQAIKAKHKILYKDDYVMYGCRLFASYNQSSDTLKARLVIDKFISREYYLEMLAHIGIPIYGDKSLTAGTITHDTIASWTGTTKYYIGEMDEHGRTTGELKITTEAVNKNSPNTDFNYHYNNNDIFTPTSLVPEVPDEPDEPDEPEEPTEPTFPSGSGKRPSDITVNMALGGESPVSNFVKYYYLSQDEMDSFITYIKNLNNISWSDFLSHIVSVKQYHFDISEMISTTASRMQFFVAKNLFSSMSNALNKLLPNYEETDEVNNDISVVWPHGDETVKRIDSQSGTMDLIEQYITYKDKDSPSFLDFAPYTSVEIYAPECNWVQIPDKAMGKKVKLALCGDVVTGGCNMVVQADFDGNWVDVAQKSGVFGVDVTISSNGSGQKSGALTQSIGAGLGSTAMTYAMTGGNALATGMTAFGAVTQACATLGRNYATQVGTTGDNSNYLTHSKAYIKISRPVINRNFDKDIYGHTVGFMCGNHGVLESFAGFTVCNDPHVDIPNATDIEKDMIENLLATGVICPNPNPTTPTE